MDIKSHSNQVKIGSNRQFGLVFAGFFALIACYPLINEQGLYFPLLYVGLGFLAISLIYPKALYPLNFLWFKFGLFLHKIVSPIVLGLIFFIVLTPIARLKKLFGKSSLELPFEPEATSYWKKRTPGSESTLSNQF